jgi:putative transposase
MPRNSRCVEPGLAYHVTQRGSNRQRVFHTSMDYRMYLGLLREEKEDAEVEVLAYCLMGNHVHLIVRPGREDSLAVLFQRVHGKYAQYLNIRRRRSGHLWQARYYSCPLSERHLWSAMRYVEQNPCRVVMVARPEEYRWSSAGVHLGVRSEREPVVDLEFWREQGGAERWRGVHERGSSVDEIRLIRKCTYAGRPYGEEEFIEQMEQKFSREWRRWGFENKATGTAN